MKIQHFEKLSPICPCCRRIYGNNFTLKIGAVEKEKNNNIQEGILTCPNEACLREFPIIDGIPLIIDDLRQYISQNILSIVKRHDLSSLIESIIGDCCQNDSVYNSYRHYISVYASDHYKDQLQEKERASINDVLLRGLETLKGKVSGPIIDIGCSVGRSSFELAESFEDLVLGVDLNFGMLQLAQNILLKNRVVYEKRRVGLVYEKKDFSVIFDNAEKVDFWACDATALPFQNTIFSMALSLNVLDCVSSPYEHLLSITQRLKQGGKVIITTPYDWSNATAIASWIGGHSQRSKYKGFSELILRDLIENNNHPMHIDNLKIISEIHEVPWNVRLHDRSTVNYQVHMVVLEKCI